MSDFITSDLHLGHRRIIEFCPMSRDRFNTVDEMNEGIITDINSVVSDTDRLYILGDIAFANPRVACDYIKRINGEKVIVWGNHDRKLQHSSEFAAQRNAMRVVSDQHYISRHVTVDGVKHGVVMMHFPIHSWEGASSGSFHFFGHLHSRHTNWVRGRSRDIGIDTNGASKLAPYSIESLIRQRLENELLDPSCIHMVDHHE